MFVSVKLSLFKANKKEVRSCRILVPCRKIALASIQWVLSWCVSVDVVSSSPVACWSTGPLCTQHQRCYKTHDVKFNIYLSIIFLIFVEQQIELTLKSMKVWTNFVSFSWLLIHIKRFPLAPVQNPSIIFGTHCTDKAR